MTLYQRMITKGLLLAGLTGLMGCFGNSEEKPLESEQKPTPSYSFATVKMHKESGIALTSGDFDGDGDLDLIVGTGTFHMNSSTGEGKVYFLRNQHGEFSQPSLFATVKMHKESGIALTSGDFDGDGDLDLIVGTGTFHMNSSTGEGKVYRFNNDGDGNFSQ